MQFVGKPLYEKRGQALLLVVLLFPIIIGFFGLAIDLSWITYSKGKIQNAADFAALSGAQYLPDNTTSATAVAIEIFEVNYGKTVPIKNINFYNQDYGIKVRFTDKLPLFILPVIGVNKVEIRGMADARVEALYKPLSIIPLGISHKNNFSYGTIVTLFGDTLDPIKGNFAIIDPTSNRSMNNQELYDYIVNDYKGEKGMPVAGGSTHTRTGSMSKMIEDGFNERLKLGRTQFIAPVVDWSNATGGSITVPILGFAMFDTLTVHYESSSKATITGKFIQHIDSSTIDTSKNAIFYGVGGIRLVK